ncbi:glutathione S-transferase [Xylariales sp. AK1849]|nr:glutathione S-transferase [Xylariales sp. AK1849]
MPLEIYHLHLSQSERLVWLLEEMEVDYNLHVFKRDPVTALAPAELKAINPAGTAPYFRDTSVSPEVAISESTAIVAYILGVYSASSSGTRMFRTPDDPDYATYLEWFHYANGTLQSAVGRQMVLSFAGALDSDFAKSLHHKLLSQLQTIDEHLGKNKWFAGKEVSAADCMTMFSLSTMRGFAPLDLGPYANILRWMRDVAARPAYRRAIEKGDAGMDPMIGPNARKFTEFAALKGALEKF